VIGADSLNRRQAMRAAASVALAQIGIMGFDGQIQLEELRLRKARCWFTAQDSA
jgi:hypothetical protein